ncbi:FG-GAP repeat domain-containing protein, partial [Kribbella deserti]
MKKFLAGLSAALLVVALTAGQPAWAVPPTPSFPAAIDPYSPPTTPGCDPTAKPGVVDFLELLQAEYGRSSLGIVRRCDDGDASHHHEGRALDYPFNANLPSQLTQATELLAWLLATDQHGNRHALARRLGISYMIWNSHIWSASNPSAGWQDYDRSNPHTDHIHFSFSWAGARRQTSWWTSGSSDRAAESVNGDQYDDVLAVDPGNVLRLFPGNSSGTFGASSPIGPGWSSAYNRIAVGDSNADGAADIVATSTDGKLHYWHNSGSGTFSKLANSGVGWTSIEWFAMVDINRDNRADIVGRDGGFLYWYPGKGAGAFGERIKIGEGWATYPEFAGA